jgi:hypothetical protein
MHEKYYKKWTKDHYFLTMICIIFQDKNIHLSKEIAYLSNYLGRLQNTWIFENNIYHLWLFYCLWTDGQKQLTTDLAKVAAMTTDFL